MAASSRRILIVGASTSLLLLGVAGYNWAQNQLELSFHAFQDTRGVTVLSPDANLSKDFSDRTNLKVKFGVDAISAASDSCARCHPDGANNGRVVGSVNLTRKYGDSKVTFGGELSKEQFYTATTGLVSVSRDLNKSNTTVAGGFSFSLNQPQLHPSHDTETQQSLDGYVSVSQSWTKRTVTQFGYELNQVNGYQTNPFLRTSVNGVMTVGNSPDARTRHAITARLRQALPGDTFFEADYRRYHDTWSIDSDTYSVGLSHHFGGAVVAVEVVRLEAQRARTRERHERARQSRVGRAQQAVWRDHQLLFARAVCGGVEHSRCDRRARAQAQRHATRGTQSRRVGFGRSRMRERRRANHRPSRAQRRRQRRARRAGRIQSAIDSWRSNCRRIFHRAP